jgi:4-hydroxy-tetrahydrodipicolinate reductase
MSIRVIINGAQGRLGRVAVNALATLTGFELVAQCTRADNLLAAIKQHTPQIVIELTSAESVYANSELILSQGVRPIIGATGLTQEQIIRLQNMAAEQSIGGIIAPNFSLGALLLMRLAKMAAPYFSHVEIIEMHHEQKKDAPSGTALLTAAMINQQGLQNSRATDMLAIPIHSLRLPGVLARQQVIFGAPGETLTLDHNTQNRDVYSQGIRMACEKVMNLNQLIYGLEQLLD